MTDSTQPIAPAGPEGLRARRALAHALGAYLDAPRVRDAVALWGEHAGEAQGNLIIGLRRYCMHVAEAFGLAGQEAELHLRILRAVQMDPSLLPADPLAPAPLTKPPSRPTTGSGAAPTASAASAGPLTSHVLEHFFVAVEGHFARELPPGVVAAQLRRSLILLAVQLPSAQRAALLQWCRGQTSVLDGSWPAGGHGTALVNLIYVALAELVGPVRADRCFNLAVTELQSSSDPAIAEIRRYL